MSSNELTQDQREAQNINQEADQDIFQKMIKFKKENGEVYDYVCDGEIIPLGTRMIAHAIGWTKSWIHFEARKVVERKVYRVARGERCPERDTLPDQDQKMWPPGLDGRPADPWVLQYLLPLENPETGEVNIFVGGSFGARRAVSELCSAYGRRRVKIPGAGQPIIKLAKALMPTKNFGDVPRPLFEIIGWDDENLKTPVKEISEQVLKQKEYDDEIPF